MRDFERYTPLLSSVLQLEHASRISRRQYIYMRFFDHFHLSFEDLHRKLILRDVVNPGASATLIGVFDLDKPNTWNGFQELTRFHPYSLAVNQVTGIVIADSFFQRNL